MKKVMLGIILLVCSISFSQIKITDIKKPELIGEIKLMGKVNISLTKENDNCTFTYIDEKFSKISNYKFFTFKLTDLESIYELLISEQEKGTKKSIQLENNNRIDVEFNKSMGSQFISIYHFDNAGNVGLCRMNTKQINKVFGKQ